MNRQLTLCAVPIVWSKCGAIDMPQPQTVMTPVNERVFVYPLDLLNAQERSGDSAHTAPFGADKASTEEWVALAG